MGVGVEASCTPHSLIIINGNQSSGRGVGGREMDGHVYYHIIFTSHGKVTSPQHKVSAKKILVPLCTIFVVILLGQFDNPPPDFFNFKTSFVLSLILRLYLLLKTGYCTFISTYD